MIQEKYLVILAVLVIFTVPIIDSGSVFFSRVWRKKSPFAADNSHLHHLVLALAKSHVLAALIISFGLVVLIVLFSQLAFILPPEMVVYIYFGGLFAAYLILFFVRRSLRSRGLNC